MTLFKKLLIPLAILLSLTIVQAATTFNCTSIGQLVICPDPICTPCPEPWNITIWNMTIPNITCSYDTTGFADSMEGCMDEVTSWMGKFQNCDGNLARQEVCNITLKDKINELSSCRAEVTKKDEEKNTYAVYGGIAVAAVAWVIYQSKVTPSASKRLERE